MVTANYRLDKVSAVIIVMVTCFRT